MTSERVRVGIAGLGRAGWSIHAMELESHPSYQLVAVTDPVPERRHEAVVRFGCRAYETYAGLIEDSEVDLVVIATPSHLHAPMSIAALEAGKHVLTDKPMALCVPEAEAMLAAAQRNGKLLTVFQMRRLAPDFLKIQEVLRSGVLGPLHEIKIAYHDYDRRRDWQTLSKFGGGQLSNAGSHFLDLALALAGGEWQLAFADLRQVACGGDAEDHVKVVFRGRAGVLVDVEIGVSAYSQPRWWIMGKYGSLSGNEQRLEWKYYDPASLVDPVASEGAVADRKYGSGETLPWVTNSAELPIRQYPYHRLFYDRLYASLCEGAPLVVPPEETRNLVALQDACRAQAVAGTFGR